MLSLTCKTAIKAVIYLASQFDSNEKTSIKDIATYINASEHSVGKMLQILVKENVINSAKGPTGGFFIDEKQISQPLINIVFAIDAREVFNQCGLGLSKCSADHPCPIHEEYKGVRTLLENIFRNKKISDLCHPVNSGLAYLVG